MKNIVKDKTSSGNSLDKNPTLSENSLTFKNQDKIESVDKYGNITSIMLLPD